MFLRKNLFVPFLILSLMGTQLFSARESRLMIPVPHLHPANQYPGWQHQSRILQGLKWLVLPNAEHPIVRTRYEGCTPPNAPELAPAVKSEIDNQLTERSKTARIARQWGYRTSALCLAGSSALLWRYGFPAHTRTNGIIAAATVIGILWTACRLVPQLIRESRNQILSSHCDQIRKAALIGDVANGSVVTSRWLKDQYRDHSDRVTADTIIDEMSNRSPLTTQTVERMHQEELERQRSIFRQCEEHAAQAY